MNCAIIGSTKIAEVHAENLIRNGIKEVTFISRYKKKGQTIIKDLKKRKINFDKVILDHANIKIFKKKKFDIICMCSKTSVHDKHLRYISGLKSIFVVEKPIISILKFKNKYLDFLNEFYKSNKKAIVCYPYLYLAENIKKYFKNKKNIKKIKFEFQTGGRSKGKKICENLMPHALSFLNNYFNNKFLNKNYERRILKIGNNKWKVSFYINKINIILILKENPLKKTSLHFTVNDFKIIRKTKMINGVFTNFIQKHKSKKINIIKK